jgi:hypothetical protein
LTETEEEALYQTYLLTRNKAQTSRIHNRSYQTTINVIKKIEEENRQVALVPGTEDHRQARINVAANLQGRVMGVAMEVLESIKKDDLTDGVHTDIEYDDNGNIVHKRMYGARGVEKATMFGILHDKLPVSEKFLEQLRGTNSVAGLLMPEDRDSLLEAIRGKVDSIQALRINFKEDSPDLATRVEAAETAYHEELDPDVITLEDLDNA